MTSALIAGWPSIGIREKWIENRWTEDEMNSRALELGVDVGLCALQPYYQNFLQQPGDNQAILENRWIAAKNLWTPGQTINIVFNSGSSPELQNYVKAVVLQHLQPHVSMIFNFTEGTTGDVLVNLAFMSAGGGTSAIGKQGKQQTINLNTDRFKNIASDMSRVSEPAHSFSNPTGKASSGQGFILTRYLITHEFGHMCSLLHEWTRENCTNNNCSAAEDPYSVMGYFNSGTMGVQGVKPSLLTMDSYSPTDIQWLESVYKPTQVPKSLTPIPTPPLAIQTPTPTPPPPPPTSTTASYSSAAPEISETTVRYALVIISLSILLMIITVIAVVIS